MNEIKPMTAIAATHPTPTPQRTASDLPTSALSDRFILAQVQSITLVIPAIWVAEIFRVERSQILPLPFYSPLIVGITHQGGQVLPLLSAHSLLTAELVLPRENSMVVKLGDAAGSLAQVGLVIDRTLGSQSRTALPSAIFLESPQFPQTEMMLLRPEMVSADLWQPICWVP
jgi:CheW-like domain